MVFFMGVIPPAEINTGKFYSRAPGLTMPFFAALFAVFSVRPCKGMIYSITIVEVIVLRPLRGEQERAEG
jgi:hypothetical protein